MNQGTSLDLESLMKAYVLGDDLSAFEKLYRQLSPKVYGYLKLRLSKKEDVDEVFQKTFAKFHSSRQHYDPKYPVLQWLFVIARSTLLDHLKSDNRKENLKSKVLFENLSQTEGVPSLSHQMASMKLKSLGPDAQEIVNLRVVDELSFEEIANRLGKSETNIRQILSRSLKKLRNSVEDS